jgi:hypothetical protein
MRTRKALGQYKTRLDNGGSGRYGFRGLFNGQMEAACMLNVGDTAPDFTLQTHEGQPLTLSSLRGHKVLLWFYPKADTPG